MTKWAAVVVIACVGCGGAVESDGLVAPLEVDVGAAGAAGAPVLGTHFPTPYHAQLIYDYGGAGGAEAE